MPKTALIAGSSGLVGSVLVRLLLESGDYQKVVSVGRRSLGWSHPKLQQIVADFSKLDALPTDLKVDDAFCALGSTVGKAGSREAFKQQDYETILRFARASLDRGAKMFSLVSAANANPLSKLFYLRMKGELEQAIRALRFPSLVIVRPFVISGHRPEPRLKEEVGTLVLNALKPILIGKLKKYRAVSASSIAEAMRAAATSTNPGTRIIESEQLQ